MATTAEHGFWVVRSIIIAIVHKKPFWKKSLISQSRESEKHTHTRSPFPPKMEPRVSDTSTRVLSGLDLNIPPFQGEESVLRLTAVWVGYWLTFCNQ